MREQTGKTPTEARQKPKNTKKAKEDKLAVRKVKVNVFRSSPLTFLNFLVLL